jgi:hypothetical protein
VLKFGVIAEGPTDQTVIENILLGFFEDQEDEPAIQYNDYLVIHIDTDVQEEPGFDVPRREKGKNLSVPDRVDRVIARLKRDIDEGFSQANAHRILFAIAVDTIECWLLPLLHRDKKAAKTTGCLESASQALRKADRDALSAGENKFIRTYEKASSDYRKRRTLIELHDKNPSLELFIKQLQTSQGMLGTNDPPTSQEHGSAASE